jgi:hypothetical protein
MVRKASLYWILDGHTPVPVGDPMVWARFMVNGDLRQVALSHIHTDEADEVTVSTVFLGLDHNWAHNGPPLFFESLVFGGPLDGELYRYPTWADAEAGHAVLIDEAIIEGKVAAWEVRNRLAAIGRRAALTTNQRKENYD